MPDQMPTGGVEIAKSAALPFPLLNSVLAKIPQPGNVRRANRFRRMRLRHTDQGDLFVMTPSPQCSRRDPLSNPQQIFAYNFPAHATLTAHRCFLQISLLRYIFTSLLQPAASHNITRPASHTLQPCASLVKLSATCSPLLANSSPSKASMVAASALNSTYLKKRSWRAAC